VLSRLESLFLDVVGQAGLPLPETNRPAGAFRVDCRWPAHALIVELDSYRFHNSRHSWQQDRRRERDARARGDEFRRYTWEDVREDPAQMLAELSVLLAGSRRSQPGHFSTGRRGERAKRSSVLDRSHSEKDEPRVVRTTRWWRQLSQSPAFIARVSPFAPPFDLAYSRKLTIFDEGPTTPARVIPTVFA